MQSDSSIRNYFEERVSTDSDGVNQKIFGYLSSYVKKIESPVILDIGAGTGAVIRRMVKSAEIANPVFYGLDASRDLLDEARRQIAPLLERMGFAVKGGDQVIIATKDKRSVDVHLVTGDFFDEKLQASLEKLPLSGITTHAFLDLVPIEPTVAIVARLLKKGGFFYSSINYNGATELFPFFEDRSFEERLLSTYNRSMDERRVDSQPAGGSRAGGLLYGAVADHGFKIAGFGSSDWSIFPWNGSYTPTEENFLNSLLLTIYEEGLRHSELDRYSLAAWYATRSESVEQKALALLTHQTDLLAIKK